MDFEGFLGSCWRLLGTVTLRSKKVGKNTDNRLRRGAVSQRPPDIASDMTWLSPWITKNAGQNQGTNVDSEGGPYFALFGFHAGIQGIRGILLGTITYNPDRFFYQNEPKTPRGYISRGLAQRQ